MVFISPNHKCCSKCKEIKTIEDFHKDKLKKDGHKSQCKQCVNNKRTPNKIRKIRDISSNTHHCKKCNTVRPISDFFKDKSKPDGIAYTCKYCRKKYMDGYHAEYFQKNKTKKAEYRKNKRNNNPLFKLKDNISSLFYNSFRKKGFKKQSKTFDILGCSYEYFMQYFESKFTDGMTFNNYGEWVIDHIIPLATAKTEEDIIKLNHYTNLQPLWKKDNRDKSDKLDWKKP